MGLWIDGHCDTLLKKYYERHQLIMVSPGVPVENASKYHATSKLLLDGGIDVQITAMWVPIGFEKLGLDVVMEKYGILSDEIHQDENLYQIKQISDFSKVKDKSKLGYILAIEGAIALGNNLKFLPAFYDLGVRVITLVWSRKNLFAEGVHLGGYGTELLKDVGIDEGEGLSPLGIQLVKAMNELGIAIDVSHLNRKGFQDVVKHSSSPFIASHSCAYSLLAHKRNLSNEQIKQIADTDGCIGINFAPGFLVPNPQKDPATIDHVIQNITYITNLVGVDYVALGSDFDGIDQTPVGLENASKFKDIPTYLKQEGYSQNDIDKIMGENWQRVFRAIWKT